MKKKIKKNDLVKIIYGKDKNKIGKVIKKINNNFVYVENIKMVKKHIKINNVNLDKNFSKIIEIESKIHISNIKLIR